MLYYLSRNYLMTLPASIEAANIDELESKLNDFVMRHNMYGGRLLVERHFIQGPLVMTSTNDYFDFHFSRRGLKLRFTRATTTNPEGPFDAYRPDAFNNRSHSPDGDYDDIQKPHRRTYAEMGISTERGEATEGWLAGKRPLVPDDAMHPFLRLLPSDQMQLIEYVRSHPQLCIDTITDALKLATPTYIAKLIGDMNSDIARHGGNPSKD